MTSKTIIDEPILVQDTHRNEDDASENAKAADFWLHRYHVGDNVVVNHDGKEWFAVIKEIFLCPEKNIPMFRGAWFWTASDINNYTGGTLKVEVDAADEMHELILGEDRDINRIDTIERKAVVLSKRNFEKLRKQFSRKKGLLEGLYFCERLFMRSTMSFKKLGGLLFPGDPVPKEVLDKGGLDNEQLLSKSGLRNEDVGVPLTRKGSRKHYLIEGETATQKPLIRIIKRFGGGQKRAKSMKQMIVFDEIEILDLNAVYIT